MGGRRQMPKRGRRGRSNNADASRVRIEALVIEEEDTNLHSEGGRNEEVIHGYKTLTHADLATQKGLMGPPPPRKPHLQGPPIPELQLKSRKIRKADKRHSDKDGRKWGSLVLRKGSRPVSTRGKKWVTEAFDKPSEIDALNKALYLALNGAEESKRSFEKMMSNGLEPEEKAKLVIAHAEETVAQDAKRAQELGLVYNDEALQKTIEDHISSARAFAILKNLEAVRSVIQLARPSMKIRSPSLLEIRTLLLPLLPKNSLGVPDYLVKRFLHVPAPDMTGLEIKTESSMSSDGGFTVPGMALAVGLGAGYLEGGEGEWTLVPEEKINLEALRETEDLRSPSPDFVDQILPDPFDSEDPFLDDHMGSLEDHSQGLLDGLSGDMYGSRDSLLSISQPLDSTPFSLAMHMEPTLGEGSSLYDSTLRQSKSQAECRFGQNVSLYSGLGSSEVDGGPFGGRFPMPSASRDLQMYPVSPMKSLSSPTSSAILRESYPLNSQVRYDELQIEPPFPRAYPRELGALAIPSTPFDQTWIDPASGQFLENRDAEPEGTVSPPVDEDLLEEQLRRGANDLLAKGIHHSTL